jgi:N-acyl-D-aspartate/D-glutamate deacylase
MEERALGITTALIYAPNNCARTPELLELARESARCGGMYTAHMRSEGDHIEDAVRETIEIARERRTRGDPSLQVRRLRQLRTGLKWILQVRRA